MINKIPPITEPIGASWQQPKREDVVIDELYALMTQADFDLLKNYSNSLPSGVYAGKMWKRFESGMWYLVWYGLHEDANKCTIESRVILIA